MVSADNVHLDVLELIFAYLSGSDLASIALVSRSFFAGVIPRLYSTLLFRLTHAKRYMSIISPFAAVALHPELGVHVRYIDIRTVPIVKSQYHPKFLKETTLALSLCPNIISFRCSTPALPPFISTLQSKGRLRDLRINATLTSEQSTMLVKLEGIRNLTLDFASWNLLNMLPKWTGSLTGLTTLTLFMAQELNDIVLESVVQQLPALVGLHVVGCSKVDHVVVLGLLSHTPDLQSLSMTTGEGNRILPTPPPHLPHLRHLALDTRLSASQPPSTTVISSILTYLSPPGLGSLPATTSTYTFDFSAPPPTLPLPSMGPRLESFIVRYPDRQMSIPATLTTQLAAMHGSSLRSVSFIDCVLGVHDALPALLKGCTKLERLEVALPIRDMTIFTAAIAHSRTLRVLVDVEAHSTSAHNPRPSLTQDTVRHLFVSVPTLGKVVVEGTRVWTRGKLAMGRLGVSLDRKMSTSAMAGRMAGTGMHWFMPREA
ncbi:hypothetical protein MIND_01166300 [Mycena indigotica]|uniref:F-box domain-containing protein n=1 Tax=Mycena indigotica TaxID=2126181 RepID=A0A8H6VUR0_9AGAR|nr:uncharacterized protein MIND_01166300 [Mycena indigotica]KAF7292681.1 hypothetical protein MIND_01166300 [Mycena indigotica]